MPSKSGGSGSRVTAEKTRVSTEARTASGRYRQLGKDQLLSAILGETADEAAAEEAALSELFEHRQREEVERQKAEELARQKAVEDSLVEERTRRQLARERRHRVALEIEEEELRLSGLWPRVDETGPQRATAPNTDEFATLTAAQLRAGAHADLFRPSELATARRSRVPTVALAVAAALLAGVLGLWIGSTGPDLDESAYARTRLEVVSVTSPRIEVATRALAAEPDRGDRGGRRGHRDRREGSREVARAEPDAVDDGSDAPAREERSGRTPLDLSLENAGELWRVGSE